MSIDPYTTPSAIGTPVDPLTRWRKIKKISGWTCLITFLLATGSTIFGMLHAFNQLAHNQGTDPSELADSISLALIPTMFASLIFLPALILFLVALFKIIVTPKSPSPFL